LRILGSRRLGWFLPLPVVHKSHKGNHENRRKTASDRGRGRSVLCGVPFFEKGLGLLIRASLTQRSNLPNKYCSTSTRGSIKRRRGGHEHT